MSHKRAAPFLETLLYAKKVKVALILHVAVMQDWFMRAKYWGSWGA